MCVKIIFNKITKRVICCFLKDNIPWFAGLGPVGAPGAVVINATFVIKSSINPSSVSNKSIYHLSKWSPNTAGSVGNKSSPYSLFNPK